MNSIAFLDAPIPFSFPLFAFNFTERVLMVQTESQYICIHRCLLLVLEGKENTNRITATHVNQGYDGKSLGPFQFDEFIHSSDVSKDILHWICQSLKSKG